MRAYYNEIEPYCCDWLENLMREGLIMEGDIDRRSIKDVAASDLRGYTQAHFFAGIGGWSYALRLAGWPDSRPAWTGSCPCQPFSVAGKRAGTADPRHLWPAWFRLIRECRPPVVFGEQVASAKVWLDGVYTDLESEAYAVGAAVLPACAVDAPHRRDRLWFVADALRAERGPLPQGRHDVTDRTNTGREETAGRSELGSTNALADADRRDGHWWSGPLQVGRNCIEGQVAPSGDAPRTQWRIEPGVPLLADGVPARVAKLRAFGNAIVPQVAATFIKAYAG